MLELYNTYSDFLWVSTQYLSLSLPLSHFREHISMTFYEFRHTLSFSLSLSLSLLHFRDFDAILHFCRQHMRLHNVVRTHIFVDIHFHDVLRVSMSFAAHHSLLAQRQEMRGHISMTFYDCEFLWVSRRHFLLAWVSMSLLSPGTEARNAWTYSMMFYDFRRAPLPVSARARARWRALTGRRQFICVDIRWQFADFTDFLVWSNP